MNPKRTDNTEAIWFCDIDDQVSGPFTFDRLQKMASDGELRRNDYVQKGEQVWIPAHRVTGIFRDAPLKGKQNKETRQRKSTEILKTQERIATPPWFQQSISKRRLQLIIGGIVVSLVALVTYRYSQGVATFPPPIQIAEKPLNDPMEVIKTSVFRAPVPDIPSIAEIPLNTLLSIPGLEEVSPGFSPSLTDDLNTIVFSGKGSADSSFDLYEARRTSPEGKFTSIRILVNCSTAEDETHCSLSPDGLELLFLRKGTIMRCVRESNSGEFGNPEPWIPFEFTFDAEAFSIDSLHFVGRNSISFCQQLRDQPSASREFLISYRDGTVADRFGKPRTVLFDDNTPEYSIAAGGKRSYFGWKNGLSFVIRGDAETPFSNNRILVSAAVTGPIDGPVWISPKEDMVFFCSPGAEQSLGVRKLWMVRF